MKKEKNPKERDESEESMLDEDEKTREKRKSFHLDESLIACGVGPCKPKFVQRFATIQAFAANVFVIGLLFIAAFAYLVGALRTIEKRFGFPSVKSGGILSAADITQTCLVIFVGYFGDRAHKTRILSVMMSIIGISLIFFFSGPYFYLSNESENEFEGAGNNTTEVLLCDGNGFNGNSKCEDGSEDREGNKSAYILFVVGAVLFGVGGSSCSSMIFSYIDENIEKEDSAIYIGIVLSAFPFGPVVGFGLAAITLTLPENLVDSPYEQSDPRFIGAWWLGFLILGICMVLACFPLFFFPKHLPKYYLDKHKAGQNFDKSEKSDRSIVKEIKDFFTGTWRLVSNPAFLTLLLSAVCLNYIIQVASSLPRYLEIHFRMSASKANIVAGIVGALAPAFGNLLSGWLMKKLKMSPSKAALFYVVAIIVALGCLVALMLIPCPQSVLAGIETDVTLNTGMTCLSNCSCDDMTFDPVCDSNGMSYFSPCFAGCNIDYGNKSFGGCTCVDGGTVTWGMCEEQCGNLIVYSLIFFAMGFSMAMGQVPATVLILRIVGEKQKASGLAMISFFTSLLSYTPAPFIYGKLFDTSCLLWKKLCSGTGVCLQYDIDQFRYKLHGVTSVFILASLIFAVKTFFIIRRSDLTLDDNDNKEDEKTKNKQ